MEQVVVVTGAAGGIGRAVAEAFLATGATVVGADIEEIAWRNGWIDDAQLAELAAPLVKGGYGVYLQRLLDA